MSFKKDFLFVYENEHGKNVQKKLGLKRLLENIQQKKFEFLHGFNTCMNECLNNFKLAGGLTQKKLNQWQTWDARVQFKISQFNTGSELAMDRLLAKLKIPLQERLREVLRSNDREKKKRQVITSSHIYKKRLNELNRIKISKRNQRKIQTPQAKLYKSGKKKTQPLEDEESTPFQILSCPFKNQGCNHKGFRLEKCLQNHITKKHSNTSILSTSRKKKHNKKKIDTKKNSKARGEKRGRIQVSTKENKQQKKKRKI